MSGEVEDVVAPAVEADAAPAPKADDLETIQSWMEEAPFYWGFDKLNHRP